jgi:hypothetical protein
MRREKNKKTQQTANVYERIYDYIHRISHSHQNKNIKHRHTHTQSNFFIKAGKLIVRTCIKVGK